MTRAPQVRTPRLLLRRWRAGDRAPFAAMNADPRVMEYFPAVLDRDESDALVDSIEAHFATHGFGLWVVELSASASFVGVVGLNRVPFEASFTPAVEVGWRIAYDYWSRGYATEAARAAVEYGFADLGLDEIVSFTTAANVRSRAVMDRLGMTHDQAADFDHPNLAEDHTLRRHVLYRLRPEGSRPLNSFRRWDTAGLTDRSARHVVEEMYRRQQEGDDTALDDLVAEDMVNHAAGPQGRNGLRDILKAIDDDFGPVSFEHHHLIGDGDLVAQHLTLHGTHRGSAMPLLADIPVSGRAVAWRFIHIWRVADGMIVEHWACRDDMGVLEQLRTEA